jgi:hypothetical protein
LVNPAIRRLLRRRAQRGNAVMVVVLVTMLLSAIGVYSVRNISQVDQAVGYARQADQTTALAELGATAAMAYVATLNKDTVQVASRDPNLKCVTNMVVPPGTAATCYPFRGLEIEGATAIYGGETLLEPLAGAETGSFGATADVQGLIDVELTDIQESFGYKSGQKLEDKPLDATVTTRARVVPNQGAGNDPCGPAVSSMTAKKLLRAHAIF